MTSEGSQPAGYEPGEGAPSGGDPAPYTGPRSGQPIPDPPDTSSGQVWASASVPGIRASASVPGIRASAQPIPETFDPIPQQRPPAEQSAPAHTATPPDAAAPGGAEPAVTSTPPATPPATAPSRRAVSASAAVPVASRITPPTDQPVYAAGIPVPRPRVYGTPVPAPHAGSGLAAAETAGPSAGQLPTPPPGPMAGQALGPVGGAATPGGPTRAAAAIPLAAMGIKAPAQPNPSTAHSGDRVAAGFPSAGQRPPADVYAPAAPADPAVLRRTGIPAYSDLLSPAAPPTPPTGGPIDERHPVIPSQVPAPSNLGVPDPWSAGAPADQDRFDAFHPDPTPEVAPTPHVRSGWVLLAVLAAAVLLLVVPLGIVWLATRPDAPTIEVGQCVKQSGSEAVPAACSAPGAFTVVAKVDSPAQCPEKQQPYAEMSVAGGTKQVFCLRPVGAPREPASTP